MILKQNLLLKNMQEKSFQPAEAVQFSIQFSIFFEAERRTTVDLSKPLMPSAGLS